MSRLLRVATVLIISALTLSGCGYQFQGSSSILPDDVRTVAIPIVENDTTQPGLGLLMTDALRTQFERYGVVEVLERPFGADAVLTVSIKSVETKVQGTTSDSDIELETQIVMVVAGELKKKNGQLLWKDSQLSVVESFASASSVVVTSSSDFAQGGISSDSLSSLGSAEVARGQEREALEEMTDEVARKVYFQAVAADF